MEAINSPTGKIAEALLADTRNNNLKERQGYPLEWLHHIEALLALQADLRRHTLVILFHNLNWFFWVDPTWTESNLLPVLHSDDGDDRDAAWSGFLWGARIPNRRLYMRLKDDMLAFAAERLPARRSYVEIISGMILAGWGSVDEVTGERCISSEELRNLLLDVDDEFRARILWQAQRWANEKNSEHSVTWTAQIQELLRIWPRQLSAKSPGTSARLCELAFSTGDQFPAISELVLPLLTKVENSHLRLPELQDSQNNIVDRYPKQTLALLYAVLPENAFAWPYGVEATLKRIGEADNALNMDERLIALKRTWDAR